MEIFTDFIEETFLKNWECKSRVITTHHICVQNDPITLRNKKDFKKTTT